MWEQQVKPHYPYLWEVNNWLGFLLNWNQDQNGSIEEVHASSVEVGQVIWFRIM